jgi:hypothetical protein
LREVLRRHAGRAGRIAWIDLHTGLGPNGLGERIYAGKDDKAAYARANKWWGTPAQPVTSIYDGSSTSALLRGLMWDSMYEECPQAEYTGIALEYGTLPLLEVTGALRADHWLHRHPEAPADLADGIRAADAGGVLHRHRCVARADREPGPPGDVPGRGRPGRHRQRQRLINA